MCWSKTSFVGSSSLFSFKKKTKHPASKAEDTPAIESSTAQQSWWSRFNFSAANKYGSGAGFPWTSNLSSPRTITEKRNSWSKN